MTMDNDTGTLTKSNDSGNRNGHAQPIVEKRDIYQEVEDLKLSLAVQTATQTGALATQAATQAGALATATAAEAGANATLAATQAGAVATQTAMQAGQAATMSAAIMGIWSTLAASFVMLVAGVVIGGSIFHRR